MKAKVATTRGPAVEAPDLVELIDFIGEESDNVIALADMVRGGSAVLADGNGGYAESILPGLAVVGVDIRNRAEVIRIKADRIYKAYAGEPVSEEKGGAR